MASLPETPLPLLPIRGGLIFPGTVTTFPVARARSLALLDALPTAGPPPLIGIAVQRDARVPEPTLADLHPIATLVEVIRITKTTGGPYRVTLKGVRRVRLDAVSMAAGYWTFTGAPVRNRAPDDPELRLRADALRDAIHAASTTLDASLEKALTVYEERPEPSKLADRIAAGIGLPFDKRVQLLLTTDAVERLKLVTRYAGTHLATADTRRRIEAEVRSAFGRQQRESVLRQQLNAIKGELGERRDEAVDELRETLQKLDLPEDARKIVDREQRRLDSLPQGQGEYNVVRTYLETIADLPWNERATVNDDLSAVQAQLDADHFGLEDVKKRIMEHMAVLKLSGNRRGTSLCLSGPPGTGKTSLARSIAEATGRPFVRIALGGVRDEATVRGHRRTYVGAMPGRIIEGLRKAGARNPVMLLDELDKLFEGVSGSPESALLEVLDPEQNNTFTDHYLDVPFDLSEVLFVCTANNLQRLSAPLRDRLEMVSVEGYTEREKQAIARDHLIPKQLENHGIVEGLDLNDEVLQKVVRDYTREAGVRQLEREIVRLCRASALAVAQGHEPPQFTPDTLSEHLGKQKYRRDVAERTALPGVATGLAWTPVGGDILFIETSRMPGKGGLRITGQLGDVMKESAHAALTYVRSHAEMLGIDPAFLETQDLHIHVPAGGTPKDGPSAGVTIFTALTSLLTGRRVRADLAMTGECTLRGRVLPVGGIKSKVLAAHRAGITHVIMPKHNAPDVDDLPEEVRADLTFTFAEDMSEVLAAALEDAATVTFDGADTGEDTSADHSQERPHG